jgi:cytochrome d ubiquinol oxidase subunit I
LNTLKHQPAKIAAMEAIWETERGAPLLLFAWPDEEARTNRLAISIPKGAALILEHDADAELKGLNDFIGEHPPVKPLFFGFRLMVGVGMLMLLTSWIAAWQLRRNGAPKDWMARVLVSMTFAGWVATVAGWYVTEIGRQPYLVYGVLKTADAASAVPAPMIGATLVMYLALYVVLTVSYITVLFYLARRAGEDDKRHAPAALPIPGAAE